MASDKQSDLENATGDYTPVARNHVKDEICEIAGAKSSCVAERFDLICPTGLRRIAKRYALGSSKYNDFNWTLGADHLDWSREKALARRLWFRTRLNHLIKHVCDYLARGNTNDDNLAAIAWNAIALMHSEEGCEHQKTPWFQTPEELKVTRGTHGFVTEVEKAPRTVCSNDPGRPITGEDLVNLNQQIADHQVKGPDIKVSEQDIRLHMDATGYSRERVLEILAEEQVRRELWGAWEAEEPKLLNFMSCEDYAVQSAAWLSRRPKKLPNVPRRPGAEELVEAMRD